MSTDEFKVGDIVEYKYKLYSRVTFNIGDKFKVTRLDSTGNLYLEPIDNSSKPCGGYTTDQFELVIEDAVLTPEEVFEHLRKGTQLQWSHKATGNWCNHSGTLNRIKVNELLDYNWRIKPEPEIITLNGKRYQAIED